MLILLATFLGLCFVALAAMVIMILKIADLMGPCPHSGASPRVIAVPIAVSYAAIGIGGILIVAALLPFIPQMAHLAVIAALGLVAVCLGLGFTQAVTSLKITLMDQQNAIPVAIDPAKG